MSGGYRKRALNGVGDHRHGTEKGYSYHGCRCERCREAHRESHTRWRAGGPPSSHGSGGYEKGCRCAVCKGAKQVCNAESVARQRARAAAPRVDLSRLA